MAVQCHPRSLILVQSKARMQLPISHPIGPILPCFRDSDIAGFLLRTATHPYFTRILGMFPLDYIADRASRSENPKLINCLITFELNQLIWS